MNTEPMSTHDALRELARRAALSLVADELRGMLAPPITVTIHPQPTRKLLAPAKRRGRPKGPKAEARKVGTGHPGPMAKRLCRRCWKRGGVSHVAGTERTLRCSFCKGEWEGRLVGAKRLTPSVPAGACFRCDHPADKHPGGGACLAPRCSCESLYQ